MHIFQLDTPVELAVFNVSLDRAQAFDNGVALGIAEYADLSQHGGVGDGTLDVVLVKALVEIHRGGKAGDEGINRFAEPATPGLICCLVLAHMSVFPRQVKAHSISFHACAMASGWQTLG